MAPFLRTGLCAVLALAAAPALQAATLGLETGAPVVETTGAATYDAASARFDFSFGLTDGGNAATVELNPADGTGFLSVDGAENLLFGTARDNATAANMDAPDVIEILFDVTTDSLGVGAQALATLTGDFTEGDMVFAGAFADADATLTIAPVESPAPIPLPAGGLLLLSGLGVMALRRRA